MSKRLKDEKTKQFAGLLRQMADAVDATGLPEGSVSILANFVEMMTRLGQDRVLGGVIVCVPKDEEEAAQEEVFILRHSRGSVVYELLGRLQALSAWLAQEIVEHNYRYCADDDPLELEEEKGGVN